MPEQGPGSQGEDPPIRGAISHDRAKRLISKAWDKELSESEQRLLGEHLSGCEECAAAKERMKRLIDLLDDVLRPRG